MKQFWTTRTFQKVNRTSSIVKTIISVPQNDTMNIIEVYQVLGPLKWILHKVDALCREGYFHADKMGYGMTLILWIC